MKNKAKILIYDIENMADLAWVWQKYDTNVIQYKKQGYLLCYAYKWFGEKEVRVVSLPDFKGYQKNKTDDRQLVKSLHKLFQEADIIIAHNGNSFDQKKSQARFLVHGLEPIAPYKQIDTKLEAKKYFRFNSNSLTDLGQQLGLGKKIDTGGFDLWIGCENGDKKSWKHMTDYNIQDVILLEKVYLKLRPWMKNSPNLNLLNKTTHCCAICGSKKTQKRGFSYNRINKIQRYQCISCRGWSLGENIKIDKVILR